MVKEETGTKILPGIPERELDVEYESPREDRRDRSLRNQRRDEMSLERVSVEMSDLEQNVYSEMGISPLILLEKEFKDPRSVIVSVKPKNNSDRESLTSNESSIFEEEEETESMTYSERNGTPQEDLSLSESDHDNSESESDSETDRPIIRRRRRRSSASSGE